MSSDSSSPSPKGQTDKLLDGGWIVEPQPEPATRAQALRAKADEVRKAAQRMIDEEARRSLSGVADQFERLAGSVGGRSQASDDDD